LHIVPQDPAAPGAKRRASDRFAAAQARAEPLSYTLAAATLASGMSEDTLRRLAKKGRLVLLRIEGRTFVDGESLRALIQASRVPAAETAA
jgi:hypothetical protein